MIGTWGMAAVMPLISCGKIAALHRNHVSEDPLADGRFRLTDGPRLGYIIYRTLRRKSYGKIQNTKRSRLRIYR